MVKPGKEVLPELSDKKLKNGVTQETALKSFPVIAIGGSAGAFPAYESFFSNMPPDSGMAIVLITHLHPSYKSQLAEVVKGYTALPVVEATDGISIKPDHIYIIPPNTDMGIYDRKLLLLAASKPEGIRQPIDHFFQSLANDQWNRSVAVILSGMGADGETGIRMIKENLGLTIAQDPETARYPSMPLAAIGTNQVDYILPPAEMPLKIIQYLRHPVIANGESEDTNASFKNNHAVQKILMLLRDHTGNDFSLYKKSTITRRIDRRVAYHQLNDQIAYAQYLADNPDEIGRLFNELLIGVTKFFRDPVAFASLKISMQQLIKQKKDSKTIRAWVAGCSTGEEAYSVAMLLLECVAELKVKIPPKIQVYATDLDMAALDHARAGVYHENIMAEIEPTRLQQFFYKENENYRVRKELRDVIVFARQNLISDPPFIKLDLLCCRNILIYFAPELQKKIVPIFYYALDPNGIMFMGPAETIGGFTNMFRAVDHKWKIFRRLDGNIMLANMIEFPFQSAKQPLQKYDNVEVRPSQPKRALTDIFNRALIDKFLPASVLVNERGDILYNNGNTGKYLELPRGETVVNNILKLAREELKYPLSSSMQQALASDEVITANNIQLKQNSQLWLLKIRAAAVREPGMQPLILIVFEDLGLVRANKKQAIKKEVYQAAGELQMELLYTKQQLVSTVEQMESSLERLRISNEELQSTNEELQSTNEESLTTKEEMQSLNEELMTVNSQYQAKAEELTRLNNDMKNLLDATEVCTVFLDNDLNILRYTPQVRHLFNLIASDVGRPLTHVVSNFEHPISEADIREVIDKLTIKVTDARTKNNEWYRIRIMPYRTLDNYISGAVITLTLITDYKQMQSNLQVLRDYSAYILNDTGDTTLQLNKDLNILAASPSALKLLNLNQQDLQSQNVPDLFDRTWMTRTPGLLINRCLTERKEVSETVQLTGGLGGSYRLDARPFFEETDTTPLIVLKITERENGE